MLTAEDSRPGIIENGQKDENLFSPRFRSVAAMAGWDEEALLLASLVVEDTPDRQLRQRKRSDLQSFKTPPTNSRRKRRAQRRSPASKPVAILDLDEDETNPKQDGEQMNKESNTGKEAEKKEGKNGEGKSVSTSTAKTAIPCIDKLREELSCAVCLEVCYEPSTTPCGHSFCKKCLRAAADKCGKRCPKCRQLISNSRFCTVNTVLWNTIQLLFPQEVEARKEAATATASPTSASAGSHHERTSPPARSRRNRSVAALNSPESERRNQNHHQHGYPVRSRRLRPMRREVGSRQDEDAALALRLQREEFMEAFNNGNHRSSGSSRNNSDNNYSSSAVARANLRAMASRAINIRIRGPTHH